MKVPPFLLRLMQRSALISIIRVKPEERICITIADTLRIATMEGRMLAVWSHVPNEGKRHRFTALVMAAMGLLSGTPDYFFIWPDGGGLIEVKTEDGRQTKNQIDYQSWCEHAGVRYALCRSAEQMMDVLIGWGCLREI